MTPETTWIAMLERIQGVSHKKAMSIAAIADSPMKLIELLQRHPEGKKHLVLSDNVEGIGHTLSRRICDVIGTC